MEYWFEMVNRWTFRMNKLLDFILKYIPEKSNVLIPFAGKHRFTEFDGKGCKFIYNDINKKIDADHHVDAYKLCWFYQKESFDCIIADPPYSHYQAFKTYNIYSLQKKKAKQNITYWRETANHLLKSGGIYIELGYNSTGLKMNIAQKIALGICNLGGSHNDILIIVQKKYKDKKQGDSLLL